MQPKKLLKEEDLTDQQKDIINELGNLVVIANPGSGKTSTLAFKIKNILETLPVYKGVVAISFTNKASDELEERVKSYTSNYKNSTFSTFDKFIINTIIRPYCIQLFGMYKKEPNTEKIDSEVLQTIVKDKGIEIRKVPSIDDLKDTDIQLFKTLFIEGVIVLENAGILALYLIRNSPACRKYLKARFSHFIVDEYQDTDEVQYKIFCEFVNMGIIGIAVGDINQSIFKFTGKDPKYLLELSASTDFKTYPLTINHRSPQSIIDYSIRLLSNGYEFEKEDKPKIIHTFIQGTQKDIASWLNRSIEATMTKLDISKRKEVAILVKGYATGNLIHDSLKLKHKYYLSTPLDEDSSLWGGVFKKILELVFNNHNKKYELIEKYLDISLHRNKVVSIIGKLRLLNELALNSPDKLKANLDVFIEIATMFFPNANNGYAVDKLKSVLSNNAYLDCYKQAEDDEIQLLTLHKSKGLEFELVYHLDLYEYIMPQRNFNPGESEYLDYFQDLNLHYVGITRAKKACIMITSSKRINAKNQVLSAKDSEFLTLNNLDAFRINFHQSLLLGTGQMKIHGK